MWDYSKVFLERQKKKSFERIEKSASKYVLVKKFNSAGRAGLRECINEGTIEIISTAFGKAYSLVEPPKNP